MTPREIMRSFTIDSLPDLDVAALAALDLFIEVHPEWPHLPEYKRPLVVGSGNAALTGQIIFSDKDAVFADVSSFEQALARTPSIDGVILVSSSGDKSAMMIARTVLAKGLPMTLITNNPKSPTQDIIGAQNVHVLPQNREPYTYNTSTYFGMILLKTRENPAAIREHITNVVAPLIPQNLASYDAFYLSVPSWADPVSGMFNTKFDELFGANVSSRTHTLEQTRHAKLVVPCETEYFFSFGDEGKEVGPAERRTVIPLPEGASFGALMMIGYYLVGQIQKQQKPYYKQHVVRFVKELSATYGHEISPIVETYEI